MWYYLLENERRGPVPENEIAILLAGGIIDGQTPVWSEGGELPRPLEQTDLARLKNIPGPEEIFVFDLPLQVLVNAAHLIWRCALPLLAVYGFVLMPGIYALASLQAYIARVSDPRWIWNWLAIYVSTAALISLPMALANGFFSQQVRTGRLNMLLAMRNGFRIWGRLALLIVLLPVPSCHGWGTFSENPAPQPQVEQSPPYGALLGWLEGIMLFCVVLWLLAILLALVPAAMADGNLGLWKVMKRSLRLTGLWFLPTVFLALAMGVLGGLVENGIAGLINLANHRPFTENAPWPGGVDAFMSTWLHWGFDAGSLASLLCAAVWFCYYRELEAAECAEPNPAFVTTA